MNGMAKPHHCFPVIATAIVAALACVGHADEGPFEIVRARCLDCHSGDEIQGGIDLAALTAVAERAGVPLMVDAAHGLESLPARLGVPRALRLAGVLHGVSLLLLALLPLAVPQLGPIYWCGYAAIWALLAWEHAIVRPDDLSRVNDAFFTANAVIGLVRRDFDEAGDGH